MQLTAHLYKAIGYQEALPGEENPSMEVAYIDVELSSDDGEFCYTVGRLFFPTEIFLERFGRNIELVVNDELDKEPNDEWPRHRSSAGIAGQD